MSNEVAVMDPPTPPQVAPADINVTATTPDEMQESQSRLVSWCKRKVELCAIEAAELQENLEIAIKNKWKTSTLRRHASKAAKRVVYYQKILAALEAGYCIVPNFPVDLFAIRTKKKKPTQCWHFGTYEASQWHFMQKAGLLPAGEGRYVSNDPLVKSTSYQETKPDGRKVTQYEERATDFDDVEFPIQMAKPKIMEATSRAMALKIFDQFGLFAQGTGDPIITGEIVHPENTFKAPAHMRKITFMVAWHVNTLDL